MIKIVNKNIYGREQKPYYIYVHTCPNLFTYVGVSQNPKRRWNKGEGYKLNEGFYNAIKRYGWENIRHEIVAETYYRKIAQKIERSLITEFKIKKKSYNETNIEKTLVNAKSNRKMPLKKVAQYDTQNNLIKIYNSASEAGRELEIPTDSIRNCCKGITKTAYKYVWKYI